MLTFIVRRTLWTVLVMFVITVLVFIIFFKTPGVDPARAIAGRNSSPQILAEIRAQFGLNRPLPIQYGLMMKRLFVSRTWCPTPTRASWSCPRSSPRRPPRSRW